MIFENDPVFPVSQKLIEIKKLLKARLRSIEEGNTNLKWNDTCHISNKSLFF